MGYTPLGEGGSVLREPDPRTVSAERQFQRNVRFEADAIFSSGASAQARARSANFSIADETGWAIDGAGNAWLYGTTTLGGSTVVQADLYSSDWDGSNPADLSAGPDAGASAGYYLDYSAGAAQFQSLYAEGGQIGNLTVANTLTLGTSGLLRSAASGQRIEITNAENDRINFYSGETGEVAEGYMYTYGITNDPVFALVGPRSTGTDYNYVKLQSVGASDYGVELLSQSQDIRLYLVDSSKEIEFAYAGTTRQRFANDEVYFYGPSSIDDQVIIAPGSSGNQIAIVDSTNPQMMFHEVDQNAAGEYYWFHHSAGIFYLLQDRSATPDGTWDSPHPWWVTTDGKFHAGVGVGIPNGSVSSPGLFLDSDVDTGLYGTSAKLQVTIAGEEQVFFEKRSATARSSTALTIVGNASGDNLLKFQTDRPWYFRQANTGATTKLWLQDGGSSKIFSIVDYNGNERFQFDMNTSAPRFVATPVYSQTGSASNVHVDSAGKVFRQTSALKYKTNVIYYEDRLANLEIRPVGYVRKDDDSWHLGYIADDLAAQHPSFGVYDHESGELEDFERDALLAVMGAKINRLERQVAELIAV